MKGESAYRFIPSQELVRESRQVENGRIELEEVSSGWLNHGVFTYGWAISQYV